MGNAYRLKSRQDQGKNATLSPMLLLVFIAALLWASRTVWGQSFGLPGGAAAPIEAATHSKAAIITIHGPIDAIMAESVMRRVGEAEKRGATLIIFDINSTGGLLESALKINQFIRETSTPTVGYIHRQAIAAAALVAVACQKIVMSRHGLIGDGQPFEVHGLRAKAMADGTAAQHASLVVKSLLASGQKNGLSPLVLLGMIDPGMQLDEVRNSLTGKIRVVSAGTRRKLVNVLTHVAGTVAVHPWSFVREIKKRGELLTLESKQARRIGFSQATITGEDDLLARLNVVGARVPVLRLNLMERFARWLAGPWVRFVLFLLVLVCGYLELTHPGTLIPGAIALVALLLLLGAPYLTGLALWWEIGLIILGIVIIIADIHFLGGIGLLAVPGFILMIIGLVASFIPSQPGHTGFPLIGQTFSALQTGMAVVVFGTVAAIGIIMMLVRYLKFAPGLRRLQIELPGVSRMASTAQPGIGQGEVLSPEPLYAGAVGRAVSELRPAGKASFDGRLFNVVAQGTYIARGAAIEVLRIGENQIVVRELAEQGPETPSTPPSRHKEQ